MLEGGGCRKAGLSLELRHQLPSVQGIQKINIARTAVQDSDREIASVLHKDARGLLVRVAAVFQLKFIHFLRVLSSNNQTFLLTMRVL